MSISDSPAHASCEAERVTVFDRMRLSAWIFIILWPIVAAAFVYFVCLDGEGSSSTATYLASVLMLASGVCASINTYFSDRMFNYQVLVPAVVRIERGVRVLADKKFDPLMSSVLVRLAWTLLTFGLVALMYTDPVDGTPAVVPIAIFMGIGVCLFGTVVYYWWKRRRRKQYPGDIDLSAEGMHQRLGDRVLEVTWKDLRAWRGLIHKFQGETYGVWEVVAGYPVNRQTSAVSVLSSSVRPQKFTPLLNSVGDIDKFNIMLASARRYPDWAKNLFMDPNRVDRIVRILTLDSTSKDFMQVADALFEKYPDLPLSYADLTMLDMNLPTSLLGAGEDFGA